MALSVAEIRLDPAAQQRALILTGVIGGIQMCDPIIASLALPKAGAALDMDPVQLALAASISTLCLAATVVLVGSLAERTGRHRMLLLTLALIAIGDLIVVLAPSTPVFLLGRAVTGVGAGGALACSYAYVRVVSPDDRLGRALGFWAAMSGVAAIPLALVGAGLASLDWRLAFLVIPVGAAACAVLVVRWLPVTDPEPERRQLVGVILAGLGVVGLLYGISQAAHELASAAVVVPMLTGVVLIAVAGLVGARSERPSFPVWVFRDPVMLAAALSGALWNLCLAVAVLQSSNLWQYVDGVTPFAVSVLQLPANIAVAAGSYGMGRFLGRELDSRLLIGAGFVIAAAGLLVMGLASGAAVSLWFNLGLVGLALGAGAVGTVQSQLLLHAAPDGYLSAVAASRTTFGQVGYAIGLAGSVVLTTLLAVAGLSGSRSAEAARQQFDEWLAAEVKQAGVVSTAYQDAFATSMQVWTVVVAVGGICCVALLSRRRSPVAA